jgi:hypothetical protein
MLLPTAVNIVNPDTAFLNKIGIAVHFTLFGNELAFFEPSFRCMRMDDLRFLVGDSNVAPEIVQQEVIFHWLNLKKSSKNIARRQRKLEPVHFSGMFIE